MPAINWVNKSKTTKFTVKSIYAESKPYEANPIGLVAYYGAKNVELSNVSRIEGILDTLCQGDSRFFPSTSGSKIGVRFDKVSDTCVSVVIIDMGCQHNTFTLNKSVPYN